MALTRKYLKAMGIEDDKIDQIIESHAETVSALKSERDSFKEDAEKKQELQRELEQMKGNGSLDWEKKYNDIKGDFEKYKEEVQKKETQGKKESAYRAILKDANLSEKGIEKAIKYAEWDKIELEADGKLKGASDHIKSVKEEWAEYVTTTTTTGAKTSNPPANNGTGTGKTKEEIMAIKDGAVRRAEMAKNPHLFGLDQNN